MVVVLVEAGGEAASHKQRHGRHRSRGRSTPAVMMGRHLGARLATAYIAEKDEEWEESFFTSNYKAELKEVQADVKVEDVILYTGNNKRKIAGLGSETLGCGLLDCGCTMNVCGES